MGKVAYVWPYPPPEEKGFSSGGWVGPRVGQGTGCLDNRSEQGAWWEVCCVALKQKMAQIIFVLLLVDVMVVSYAGGRSGGDVGGFVKPAKVN